MDERLRSEEQTQKIRRCQQEIKNETEQKDWTAEADAFYNGIKEDPVKDKEEDWTPKTEDAVRKSERLRSEEQTQKIRIRRLKMEQKSTETSPIASIASTVGMNTASIEPVKFTENTKSPKAETVQSPTLDETSPIASTIGMNAASIEPVTLAESKMIPQIETVESPILDETSPIASTIRDECCIRRASNTSREQNEPKGRNC